MACMTLHADVKNDPDSVSLVMNEPIKSVNRDTVISEMQTETTSNMQKAYNPVIAGGLSTLIPGLGQMHTKRYIKGSLFFATEIILGLVARDRYLFYARDKKYSLQDQEDSSALALQELALLRDSLDCYLQKIDTATVFDSAFVKDSLYLDTLDSLVDAAHGRVVFASMNYDLARFDRREARKIFYHMAFGMAGCTYFNIMDALQSSGYFHDELPRNPAVAGWLAAIPGLGMGQIYNGALSKAGMITMVQFTLGFMSYNYHTLMRDCEAKILEMSTPTNPENEFEQTFRDNWDSRRDEVFRKRNTYLWYSILFYFYGIFDAVVDAHLHDINKRMELKPDLSLSREEFGFSISFAF
ncbi:MAG: hypothetical protein GF350_01270 [Chitinivibrionales bacterium]|nr:hypothetical protein [Chitinivibrionales bacterium]